MLGWSAENITNPSLKSDIREKKSLMKYIKHNNTPAIELKNCPCHIQAVVRCVKLVSDAAGAILRAETAG